MIRRFAFAAVAAALSFSPLAARAAQPGFLYTYAVNESRFGDFVYALDAYKPIGAAGNGFRPYVDLFTNIDTKTSGGTIPRIFSDNYAGIAGGLQYTNGAGLRLFLQAGETAKVGSVATVHSGGDVRGGAQLYREWNITPIAGHPYGNFFGSAVYYSRYQDTVFYNQLEVGRYLSSGWRAAEVYLRPVMTLDTQSYYYGNLVEMTAGVRVHPFGRRGPALALEEAAGRYTMPSAVPAGQAKTWLDFRPIVTYGVDL